jgi:hypothetical protein
MCISNNPQWLIWTINLSVPVALIIINILLAKFTGFYKKNKAGFIVGSILVGVVWMMLWYTMSMTKCI